jgi:hypothetical protein
VPHIGFVGLEIDSFTAGLADNFTDIQVVVALLLDTGDVSRALRDAGEILTFGHQMPKRSFPLPFSAILN